MNQKKQSEEQPFTTEKNWLEWSVFVISLLLVLGIIGYLGYKSYIQEPSTPELFVETWLEPAKHAPNRYHVVLHNKGGATAEEVTIEFTLVKQGAEPEKAELQLPFAPQQSKREGWVGFSGPAAPTDSLQARVVSYKKP
ncbi:hypothetical protein [Pontibacter oryzae]|uniref:TIGR02588 family protein n=1 Tax=Pontibacter oryzae TaxID=2304593 RepID=A0A399SF00_9BACT|nr:hypothetical protein [Pontibacter oryzae]RIJ41389.1 hypothetical protein D1627_04920 [Pontibacter oryzae]